MTTDAGDPLPVGRPVDEGFLARIVDSAYHPYVVIAKDGTILYTSSTVRELLGAPAEHYVGRNITEVLDPDTLDRALRAFDEFVAPDRPSTGWIGPPLTIRIRHADGHLVSCRALAVPGGSDFDGLVLQVRATETTTKLDEVIASLARGDDVDTTITRIIEFASEQMPYSIGVVGRGHDGRGFESVVAHPRAPRFESGPLPTLDDTPWVKALDTDAFVTMDAADMDPTVGRVAAEIGVPTAWAVPVSPSHGRRDALVFWRRAPGPPGPHLREGIDRICRLITLALEADHSRRLLERQASTDGLTGLANRVALFDRLGALRAARADTLFGILYIDLDDFKVVNDESGHRTGDRVLEIAARRIERHVRAGDVVARLGGDEFAVLGTGASDAELEALAQRLVDAFTEPVVVDGQAFELGISIGIAVGNSAHDAIDPEQVLDDADRAMLRAKAAGKHRWARADRRR